MLLIKVRKYDFLSLSFTCFLALLIDRYPTEKQKQKHICNIWFFDSQEQQATQLIFLSIYPGLKQNLFKL